jgi:hypothetical protein
MTTETSDDDLDAEVDALLAFDEGEPDLPGAWRVLKARTSSQQAHRFRGSLVAAFVLAAAAVLAVVWTRGSSVKVGEVDASARETVAIGDRAVAVVEAGGALRWSVDEGGAARVRQTAGAVFYRVNGGDEFVVETPAGRATVTGTCFTLELNPMRNEIKLSASAMAGAAAAAVLLTVHEGRVELANVAGSVEAQAGQTAIARAGSAPELGETGDHEDPDRARGPEDDPESRYASLVRENTEQRRALRRLQEELAAARGEGEKESGAEPVDEDSPEDRSKVAQHCAVNGDCDERLWTEPSIEELRELAKCGRILVDTPSFMQGDDFFPPGYVIESGGLSEDEAARYAEIAEALYKESGTRYAELARELGVPADLVVRLAPHQLGMLLDSVIDEWDDIRRSVANERAQLSTPPEEQSPAERALRYEWSLGDEFERRLATEFGADVAKEMRHAAGGWSNKNTWSGRECLE